MTRRPSSLLMPASADSRAVRRAAARAAGAARRRLVPTARNERDAVVDVLKGIACLLMVTAHVHFVRAPWLQYVTMTTALFFACTGVNLVGIVERRRGEERRLAANALFLLLAGFADNYVQGTMRACDVFQGAGLAMLAMLALRQLWPRYWTWLFPVPFLVHLANQHCHWKVADGGVSSFVLTPGLFPLLPWLSFYLLGAHLKKHSEQRTGWLLGAAALATLAVHSLVVPFHFDKFWMTPEYFLIGCAAVSLSFSALRRWLTQGAAARLRYLQAWGANSLVFYIVNNFVLRVLETLLPHGLALLLPSVVITAALLRPMLRVQAWTGQRRPGAVLLAGGFTALAVLAANTFLWPRSFQLYTLASFGLTFAFIACYPAWKNISCALRTGDRQRDSDGVRVVWSHTPAVTGPGQAPEIGYLGGAEAYPRVTLAHWDNPRDAMPGA